MEHENPENVSDQGRWTSSQLLAWLLPVSGIGRFPRGNKRAANELWGRIVNEKDRQNRR